MSTLGLTTTFHSAGVNSFASELIGRCLRELARQLGKIGLLTKRQIRQQQTRTLGERALSTLPAKALSASRVVTNHQQRHQNASEQAGNRSRQYRRVRWTCCGEKTMRGQSPKDRGD